MAAIAARKACLSPVISVRSFAAPPNVITCPRSACAQGLHGIQRVFLRLSEVVTLAHAEGIIQRITTRLPETALATAEDFMKGPREGQHQQKNKQATQREQQQDTSAGGA